MKDCNELEIELNGLDAENYRVTLRFTKGVAAPCTLREISPANASIKREATLLKKIGVDESRGSL